MPTNDIIDNRAVKLVDRINQILTSSQAARFAVGYFFVSGLESIATNLAGVKDVRLLIGNTSNHDTIEQMAEGYRRLEQVAEVLEAEQYQKRADARREAADMALGVRATLAVMDQTDASEELLRTLVRMIEERRLHIKVYTKGRLHAKAYIFDYPADGRYEQGIAIVGSSNFTLAGVSHNTELNVVVPGNDNHAALGQWFDTLWEEAEDFDAALMEEMRASWAVAQPRPYDIYMKTLYTLVCDRLEGSDEGDVLWDDEITTRLADFQKVAVRQAVQTIRQVGGVFVADVVGLGKSYIGAAVIKHFERTEHARSLILCPAPLVDMWEHYNEVYDLNARVLSFGYLRDGESEGASILRDDIRYRDRDFVLIDESHNLRHRDTQRYKVVEQFLASGRRCCFLTATPRNKSVWDVYHQLKLFHQEDRTMLPVDPPNLHAYFKLIEEGKRQLPTLLTNILIRRTRNHVLRWYGRDAETDQPLDPSQFRDYLEGRRRAYVIVGGRHQFFPRRELATIEYSIEDTYKGLYQRLRGYLGRPPRDRPAGPVRDELTYARYGLGHYVLPAKRRVAPYDSLQKLHANLRGLMRILLFKRFESSVYAFQQTISRLVRSHELFVQALDRGIVAAGADAQALLGTADTGEDADLFDALEAASVTYQATDFDLPRLRAAVEHDLQLLRAIQALVAPITPDQDAKLQTLRARLADPPLRDGKRLIFTQYADTARYLYDHLNPDGRQPDIAVIYSGDKSKAAVVRRFAPRANPDQLRPGETELTTLIATDVLAEGLNLQDCDKIINYDLHWNPVRLIQRFGRIDRIGSEHARVYGFNFLPETALDRNLGLRERLHNRIQEIHDTIGEDSAILDTTEQLNEEAMYAIYEQKSGQLSLFEEESELAGVGLDLNEAEELFRQLRKDDPAEYDRIARLRDGVRAARHATQLGLYVFCQAGSYRQLFLLDTHGKIVSRDLPHILGLLACEPNLLGLPMPSDYNAAVMGVLRGFAREVRHRHAEQAHTLSHGVGQRYALRELRALHGATDDEDRRSQISLLDRAFSSTLTTAVVGQLNLLRRNAVEGPELLRRLTDLYHQHNLRERLDHRNFTADTPPLATIVCSEALL